MIEALAKTMMISLLVVSLPTEADPSLWTQWGLAGVVVAYVLWRDHRRERRMASAIDAQQRWIREILVSTLERNAVAMERMAAWLEGQDEPGRTGIRRRERMEGRHAEHR